MGKKEDRDASGRFAPGNSGGPGRPAKNIELEYLEVAYTACSPDDWAEIVERAVQRAKMGDDKARAFLASYLIGKPSASDSYSKRRGKAESDALFDFDLASV